MWVVAFCVFTVCYCNCFVCTFTTDGVVSSSFLFFHIFFLSHKNTFVTVYTCMHIAQCIASASMRPNNTVAIKNLLFIMCFRVANVCVQYLWWKSNLENTCILSAVSALVPPKIYQYFSFTLALFSRFSLLFC